MRVSVLEISAQLENVTNFRVPPDFQYHIKFQCKNCQTETDNFLTFSENVKVSLMSGKSTANLVFKCRMCSRPSNVSVVEGSTRAYQAEDSPTFKPLVELDCRGCDPISFQPNSFFHCRSVDNTQDFNEVDLNELNWADYDEIAQESVGIYNFKYRFITIKK